MNDPALWEADRGEALDPATPAARLLLLLRDHLDDVLQNPAMPLLLLAQPDLWSEVGRRGEGLLARSPRCPPSFVAWLLRQASPRAAVLGLLAGNPAVPAAARRAAFLRRNALEEHPYDVSPLLCDLLPQSERDVLADFLPPPEHALVVRAADGAPLSPEEFEALAGLDVRGPVLAMRHEDAPAALLLRLLDQGSHAARIFVPAHPNLPAAHLAALLASEDSGLRYSAAANPSLTEAQFAAAVCDPKLRVLVAGNPGLPQVWVEDFLSGPDPFARAALAGNPALSAEHQLALAGSTSEPIRRALARNPSLTAAARRRLEQP
jgi:hypothetical protein